MSDRLAFIQKDSWCKRKGSSFSDDPYSWDNCCYCGKSLGEKFNWLTLARTDDGEWWLVSPDQEVTDEYQQFGVFKLPVGPDCLKKHPQWKFSLNSI